VAILRPFTAASVIVVASLATTACFRAQAKTMPEMPPLDMPAPPPRVVESSDPEMPQPMPLPGEPARNTPSRPRPAPPPRAEVAKPVAEPPKVEPPVEAAKPAEEPKPPSTLQTTPAQREAEVERRVRVLLTQASNDLTRVNYQALNTEARTQYDTAKGFIRQAEEAIRVKNLNFATQLADKAAALATQLGGR
jgi:outer membrane biosynthesis protein TonB